MLVPMAQLEIVGRADRLDEHVGVLQRLATAEPVRLADAAGATGTAGRAAAADADPLDDERALSERVQALLALADAPPEATAGEPPIDAPAVVGAADPSSDIPALVSAVEDAVRGPLETLEHLRAEQDALPRTVEPLAALLPLVPELSELTEAELAALHLATIVVVLDDPDGTVHREITDQLDAMLGVRHLFASAAVGESRGCLIVLPDSAVAEVERLLGRDRVAPVELAGRYAGHSLRRTVADMHARRDELPSLIAAAQDELAAALGDRRAELDAADADLVARIERHEAAEAAERGDRTYTLRLWTPRHRVDEVVESLQSTDSTSVVTELPRRRWVGTPPVQLRNPRPARPFERLVAFLAWPQTGSFDPTGLMAAVLPVLFGIMVGDIGYGLLLAGIGWWVRRHWQRRSAVAADAGRVLFAGGLWATVFGLLFGELFGNLGRYEFGLPALWFYRGGPDALTPLLLFVLGVGVAHLLLGLLLGVWQAARRRHLPHLLERAGSLLVIGGLFGVAGVLTSLLPGGALSPAAAAVVIGLIVCAVPHGPLGALLSPLEAISRIGNLLSYLRLAAVGLASVYLAIVANELGRQAPLLLGIVIAVFFHALNLALAAFSPMIQSMRLHYVEFFGTFFDGGGRPFSPLGAPASRRSAAHATT